MGKKQKFKPDRLRRLLSLAKPEWRTLAVGTLFLIVGASMTVAFPQAVRVIIDQALEEQNMERLNQAALAMFAIFLVQGIAGGFRYYIFTVAGERVVARLREDLYAHIVGQEIGFFDQRRTGELMSRISADCGVLQNAVSVNISMLLRSFSTSVGCIGFLMWISPLLTFIMLLVVPPVAIGATVFGRRIRKLSAEVQDRLADSNKIAEESLSGIRTVRSFAQETSEVRRFGDAVQAAFGAIKRRVRYVAMFSGVAQFIGFSAIALVLWYGGRLVLTGGLSNGELTSFILYTFTVAFSIATLAGLWADFMRATGAADRVFDLMDRTPSITLTGGEKRDAVVGEISFDEVDFSYPTRMDVPVLKKIDLTLAPGESVALVGPSGSGKSTIAALMTRFYDPLGGRVLLDGAELTSLDPTWLRQQVGVVSQEPTLLSTSIIENIRYGRADATEDEIREAAKAAHADEFIRGFPEGYETEVGERGVQLSGGQKQRVAIARAILKNPRLLILDEATSALDAESEHLVQEALDRLQVGRTTLIIAHRLSTVLGADRVVVMEAGEILQTGTHKALMEEADGLYRRLVERQFAGA